MGLRELRLVRRCRCGGDHGATMAVARRRRSLRPCSCRGARYLPSSYCRSPSGHRPYCCLPHRDSTSATVRPPATDCRSENAASACAAKMPRSTRSRTPLHSTVTDRGNAGRAIQWSSSSLASFRQTANSETAGAGHRDGELSNPRNAGVDDFAEER
jgi:hypothetical protein